MKLCRSDNHYATAPLAFIFCQIVGTVFQAWYVCRRGGANLGLNYQFSKKEMFIFNATNLFELEPGK